MYNLQCTIYNVQFTMYNVHPITVIKINLSMKIVPSSINNLHEKLPCGPHFLPLNPQVVTYRFVNACRSVTKGGGIAKKYEKCARKMIIKYPESSGNVFSVLLCILDFKHDKCHFT